MLSSFENGTEIFTKLSNYMATSVEADIRHRGTEQTVLANAPHRSSDLFVFYPLAKIQMLTEDTCEKLKLEEHEGIKADSACPDI